MNKERSTDSPLLPTDTATNVQTDRPTEGRANHSEMFMRAAGRQARRRRHVRCHPGNRTTESRGGAAYVRARTCGVWSLTVASNLL